MDITKLIELSALYFLLSIAALLLFKQYSIVFKWTPLFFAISAILVKLYGLKWMLMAAIVYHLLVLTYLAVIASRMAKQCICDLKEERI
jgi:hypothetical protein